MEYLFQEIQDLPLSEGDNDASTSIPLDKQLATTHLKDLIISPMTPGETPEPSVHTTNRETHEPPSIIGKPQEPPCLPQTSRIGEIHEPPPLSPNNTTATGETQETPMPITINQPRGSFTPPVQP